MIDLLAVLTVSGLFGYGLLLVVRGALAPPASLADDLERLEAGLDRGPGGVVTRRPSTERLLMGGSLPSADLAVLEWSAAYWQRRRLTMGAWFALGGAVLVLLLRTQFDFSLLAGLILLPLLVGALGVLWVAETDRRTRAGERRKELRAALAQMLELTSIMLAGGAGPETALEEASARGHGWGFRQFSAELARARNDPALSPFLALRNLGIRFAVSELEEFGNVMILSSENAATVRQALEDKAVLIVMREQEQRRADALSRNVVMSLPVVGMAGGFILWLVYAAVAGLASF
ncbi:MAG: type II secretion system F family protein [Acidimicrobiales bacterium]